MDDILGICFSEEQHKNIVISLGPPFLLT